jgi:hypothetical protein
VVPLFSGAVGRWADNNLTCETGLSFGQTTEVGAYADQRLNLAKLGRLKEERPRLRTGPEKLGRPGLLGGLGKRGHGGNVNPPCNRKGEAGNPPPTTGALEFYPNHWSVLFIRMCLNVDSKTPRGWRG